MVAREPLIVTEAHALWPCDASPDLRRGNCLLLCLAFRNECSMFGCNICVVGRGKALDAAIFAVLPHLRRNARRQRYGRPADFERKCAARFPDIHNKPPDLHQDSGATPGGRVHIDVQTVLAQCLCVCLELSDTVLGNINLGSMRYLCRICTLV